MKKKVIVVGAGIAGLTAGIYTAQSGFDTCVLEQHTIPGGACTSWRRGGYLFEGCINWLTGSSPKAPLNKLWKETGALNDATAIICEEPFFTFEYEGTPIHLYRDTDRLKEHLLSLSPEDAPAIKKLCSDIRLFSSVSMPVTDIKGVRVHKHASMPLGDLLKMMPAFPRMGKYSNMSVADYTAAFRHPGIRAMLAHVVGEGYCTQSLLFTLATLASGDGGYPEGGSLPFVARMADCLRANGGTLRLGTCVDKILVENGRATGVLVNGEALMADAVIVTADTRSAVDSLFDVPLSAPWLQTLRADIQPVLCSFVCIGVREDLSDLPAEFVFPLKKPVWHAGEEIKTLCFRNYARYKDYAPEGCTALTTAFMGDSYDYWKSAFEDGSYAEKKALLGEASVSALIERVPRAAGKIDVVDVATPLTYERYLKSWRGSWMSLTGPGSKMRTFPGYVENVSNLFFAGQRQMLPGGLPSALYSGRCAAQMVCRALDEVFRQNVE